VKKYNVDDILRKVGLDGSDGDGTREVGPPSNGSQDAKGPGLVKRHRVDQAELAFSPLPSMPGNQGATVDTALVEGDVSGREGGFQTEPVDLEQGGRREPGHPLREPHHPDDAVKEGASDIHIEPQREEAQGALPHRRRALRDDEPAGEHGAAITSRLKIMANLDISERRLPQDGRIRCTVQGASSTCVCRRCPRARREDRHAYPRHASRSTSKLDQLGFRRGHAEIWKKQIDAPHGIVLVTGPDRLG
jgi:hypothetical protein